jgi:hypothetical protein
MTRNFVQISQKKFLIGFTVILLNSINASHAKWVFISNDNVGNAYYYDDSKTAKNTQTEEVSTWLLTSYTESLSAPNGESTQSVVQDLSYLCRTGYESYKQFYIGYYSGANGSGVGIDSTDTSDSQWVRVIPDTMSYLLFKFFCKPQPLIQPQTPQ